MLLVNYSPLVSRHDLAREDIQYNNDPDAKRTPYFHEGSKPGHVDMQPTCEWMLTKPLTQHDEILLYNPRRRWVAHTTETRKEVLYWNFLHYRRHVGKNMDPPFMPFLQEVGALLDRYARHNAHQREIDSQNYWSVRNELMDAMRAYYNISNELPALSPR